MASGRKPTASEVLDVLDRIERDPERRRELSSGYEIFSACVAEGLLNNDSVDWLAQRMQELHSEGLIAHGPVSAGVFEPMVWGDHWLQSVHDWRVTSAGRMDAYASRDIARRTTQGQEEASNVGPASEDRPDFFISHASEDKGAIARPLAEALRRRGYTVWFDEYELTLGDSLRRSVDRGLAECRFGLVILSPSFFSKQWPQRELDGLTTREIGGASKVILPVWHEVDQAYVARFSLPLADKLAVRSTVGVPAIVEQIELALKKAESLDSGGRSREPDAQAAQDLIRWDQLQVPDDDGELVPLEIWLQRRIKAHTDLARQRCVRGDKWFFNAQRKWDERNAWELLTKVAPELVNSYRGEPAGVERPHGLEQEQSYYDRQLAWLTETLGQLRADDQSANSDMSGLVAQLGSLQPVQERMARWLERDSLARMLTARLADGNELAQNISATPRDLRPAVEPEVEVWWSATRVALPADLRVRFDLDAPWPTQEPRAIVRMERVLDQGRACLAKFLRETTLSMDGDPVDADT
jgi:hypothetical protein